jgi:hypothetical protein
MDCCPVFLDRILRGNLHPVAWLFPHGVMRMLRMGLAALIIDIPSANLEHQAELKFRNPAPRTFGYWKKRSLFSKGRKYCFFGEPAYDFPHS